MDRSGGGIVAAAVLLAMFAGGGIRGSQSSQANVLTDTAVTAGTAAHGLDTAASVGDQSSNKRDGYADEIRRLTAFLADAIRNAPRPDESQQANPNPGADSRESRTAFMVALVPDPVKTPLSLIFDRSLDALEQAIQDGRFDFDRALLPWDEHEHPESSSFATRLDEREYVHGEQQVPGVLVFRRHHLVNEMLSPESVETLVVFVVGESPTAGINRGQFVTAIRLAKQLAMKTDGAQPLTIAGPSFSGSLYSLAALLKSEGRTFSRITIASGTVSDPDSVGSFRTSISRTFEKGGPVNFSSFEESSGVKLDAFIRYACRSWKLEPSNIAVISETETAYGRQPSGDATLCPDSSSGSAQPLRLYFPRGIFHVRSAYEQQFPGGRNADDDRPQLRTTLRPNLEEKHGGADSVPDFSPQMPVSQDAVLMGLVDQLHMQSAHVIVLLASDPLDTLFLVRYFKKNYPYAQLVTVGSDLLLRHESPDPAMLGVLALTTYSLQSIESTAGVRTPSGIVFPNDGSEGIYNATAVLLSCIQKRDAWCDRSIDAEPSSARLTAKLSLMGFAKADEGNYSGPRLHLDALGRDGFSTVDILPTTESWLPQQDLPPGGPAAGFRYGTNLPGSWKVLAVGVLGGIALVILCLWRASIISIIESEILLAPAEIDENGFSRLKRKMLIILLACACIAVLALVFAPVFISRACYQSRGFWFYVAGALLAGCGLCVVIACKFSGRIRFVPSIVLAVCVLLCAAAESRWQSIVVRRYVDVASQISPVLPLILLALSIMWWIWHNIAACVLMDSRRPLLPARANHSGIPSDISAEEQIGLESAMAPGHIDRRIWAPAVTVAVFAFLFIGPRPLMWSMEGRSYDWFVTLLLFISFGFLTESVVRILVIWKEGKHLLRGLNQQPFRTKMSSVGEITWNSIWKVGIAAVALAHSFFLRQVEALRLLGTHDVDELVNAGSPAPSNRRSTRPTRASFKLLSGVRLWRATRTSTAPEQIKNANNDLELTPEIRWCAAVASQTDSVWRHYEGLLEMRRRCACKCDLIFQQQETRLLQAYTQVQARFADAAGCLMEGLQAFYSTHPEIVRELDKDSIREARREAPRTSREIAEYFVNTLYMNYIITILLRIRTLAAAAAGIFVFDVLAVNSYPFEPRAFLRASMFAILILVTACFAFVYSQMHRDPVLSRMTDTKTGELGTDFWLRMLSFAGLPVVSLIAMQFPSVGNFLFSWVSPLMKVAR